MVLDAVALNIESVLVGNISQSFETERETTDPLISCKRLGTEALEIAIAYRVEKPERGLYFIGPDEHYPNKPIQVWTQGEDEDSRYWFPCFDYPGQLATSEIRVRVPKQYLAIANGRIT